MHRAFLAATQLGNRVGIDPMICLLTEPYAFQNKVAQIPPHHVVLPAHTLSSRPRTAILIPKHIPHVFLEQLSGADATAALLQLRCGKILIASIYLDYNDPAVVPTWVTDIVEYADNHQLPLLMAFDSNAHSTLYGPTTNRRGTIFEEFILQHGMKVENRGEAPTFHAFRHGGSIDTNIDVTLTKRMIPLQFWRVESDVFNGSDHHNIRWELPLELDDPPLIRPWKAAKWDVFAKTINDHDFAELPRNFTKRKIDKFLDRIYRVIGEALDKACPLRKAKPTPTELRWFKNDQRHLLNRTKRKYSSHIRDKHSAAKRKAFVKARRLYQRSCRKAKRSSWRLFVEKTPDEASMALLTKLAQRKDKRMINTLRKDDNSLSQPGTETIRILTDTHFPAATEGVTPSQHDNSNKIDTEELRDRYEDWINPALVIQALTKFKPNKAAGPDGLKPIIFRHLPHNIINAITILYKACIALGHTPSKWRDTKVIFLPKPGKPSYDIPKAYRPISLSNFLLKGLERLVVWRMEKDLEHSPIHDSQHGFTRGKSTESAISKTVDYIEQFLFEKRQCLGLFLDISSAFDSISIDHIKRELLNHNGNPELVEWYYSYLGKRHLEITLHGETLKLTTNTGFPQGGVCSAKFWLIAFDRAIQIINSNGVIGNGYADDCSVLIGGDDTQDMIDQIQPVLDELVQWGQSCGLRFNAQKTVAIMFTRAREKPTVLPLMDGTPIPYSNNVVYLGVTLDYRLFWRDHITAKTNRTKGLLMKIAALVHSYWGPQPKLMRWAYTGVVRPVLTYAAFVWAHETENTLTITRLRRLNRLAMNTMVKVPRSTPTRAMEIILDVTPLHLHIMQLGLKAFHRLQSQLRLNWVGVYPNLTHSVSHLRYWHYILEDFELTDEQLNTDECDLLAPSKSFIIDANSFVDMADSQTPEECNVYTDGSKLNEQVGAGVYITRSDNSELENNFRLPDHATVYQAEMLAIREAAKMIANLTNITTVKFYVDSQAALRALQNPRVKSNLAMDTINEINKIRSRLTIFVWTKAHVGTVGNEKADELAKAGTTKEQIIDVPRAQCNFKTTLNTKLREIWNYEWLECQQARQSKLYISPLAKHKSKRTIQWNRLKLGRYIRAVTGHNNLLYHLHNMQPDISPLCRFCLEEREEFTHLHKECPALYWERHYTTAQEPDNPEWSPDQIVEFTLIPKINDAFAKPLYNIDEYSDPDHLPSQLIPMRQHPHPRPEQEDDDSSITDISVMDATSLDTSNNDSEFDPMEED